MADNNFPISPFSLVFLVSSANIVLVDSPVLPCFSAIFHVHSWLINPLQVRHSVGDRYVGGKWRGNGGEDEVLPGSPRCPLWDEVGRWAQHSNTWYFPPTFCRRRVTMAIWESDWRLMAEERQTDRERERCPVERLIEWWCNGAYTPSRDCYINKATEETNSLFSSLWGHVLKSLEIYLLMHRKT